MSDCMPLCMQLSDSDTFDSHIYYQNYRRRNVFLEHPSLLYDCLLSIYL